MVVMDETERRVFVAMHAGTLLVVDVFTGFVLHTLRDLTKEVAYMGYSARYALLVAISWDKTVKIYNDTIATEKNIDALRIIKNAHPTEIIAGSFSEHLMLMATTTREGELRLWDFEKGNFIGRVRTTGKEIIALRFLDPYPLLVTSDVSGTLALHVVRPHVLEGQCPIVWKNMFTIMKASQVTSIEHLHKPKL
jgi:WD40 repeat protein